MRESRASARLRHPNIVSIFDFNIEPDGHPFLVMELLNGRSLKDELAAAGRMSIEDVRRIVPPLCSALQFAHSLGIVHRDLKPANVVAHEFTPGERVYKLVDFGLANIRETTADARLTGPHEFIGTIDYASPEQLSAAVVDARSDVYSMGAMVFEMLTGRVPYPGDDPFTVLNGHLSAPVPRPSTLRPELPAWLDVTVWRALAKNPDDRWTDIAEFGRALCARRRRAADHQHPGVAGRVGTARDLRARRADRPGPAGQRGVQRRASRDGPSGGDPAVAARRAIATGKGRGPGSCARRSHCRSRIRRSSRCATTAKKAGSSTSSPTTSRARACAS